MIKIKLTAGSRYISKAEAEAVENLQQILSGEDGYIIPVMFIGKQVSNREIDAILLLPDAIFLLDFKNWRGERIEVRGINGPVRCLINGAWETKTNTLPKYEYAARVIVDRLRGECSLSAYPRISSVMVFTGRTPSEVSFAGGDPARPEPRDGVGTCRIEQFPQLLAAFRAARRSRVRLAPPQLKILTEHLLSYVKSPVNHHPRRIEGYRINAEHHTDSFLNCRIYQGEGEPIKEQVWIKEYEQVFASPGQRAEREQLVLRHADVLHRFPQHKNIVAYRTGKATASHLYVILSRKPGAFLSELLARKPLGNTTEDELRRIPFDLNARLQILGVFWKH